MALLLNIDTAVDGASICISKNETVLAYTEHPTPTAHASWIGNAIKNLFTSNQLSMNDLDAIAVSNGPGSYTGLRIGLATAKGLCFALDKPLICLNTLKIMASAVCDADTDLICPVIDARRMEVYTAVYEKDLTIRTPPEALIVNDTSYAALLDGSRVLFTGNGVPKLQQVIKHSNAIFSNNRYTAANMPVLTIKQYVEQQFDDLSYTEPFYLKAVYFNKN
ncbi:tRNA (adenosine(37)-N6)-threonylcarbamoyltransferase complex dimerization subunit type 1 TsaB [Niabella beijingensis]|uniref:tRNA (adenosine(37)-N6)-threonylcarbamoyltransferase complex dimerization subunit type 1 TsaB n=1 Tax=Niabella beijingensis TaxID=2872700 RepID=UPI001CBF5356|nr:tRNA (adenosine(37)-N6)-threonylcarbamoyltransferase complex dimerization subunit type 1 TsaB [Niabella beijingensis]MBZ4188832.1 tRNA (adenosine(37)-N6)-threonylcarbamoyltransferase complex dimerization subunit type 1 TsaB [Niabella beijingensis]